MKNIHHTTNTDKVCSICNKPILNLWYDKTEANGQTESYQERRNGEVVHYFCLPNAKTLQQLNEERKQQS